MTAGVVALLAALAVAVIGGVVWQRTNGRMRATEAVVHQPMAAGEGPGRSGTAAQGLTGEDVGRPLGDRATLVQFSSAFCAPCRATRRVLADVAGMTQGVAHVEIDAESRLDLVRQLNVLRTPTVLVLAGDGTIVRRASGQPSKPDVIAAIGVAADYNSHIYDRDTR